ncbi:hypothetical protein HW555_006483 [Spodoptera exigua]|uniref:THAP9-like helix-turn-helix domain-containing protein n=1 Tax=Spodoptera exigua TaxID=7107 RepID=A0A835GHT5_SPOEX|nr:hypothetical protein HW555_006483 [Spodoptera exigua]
MTINLTKVREFGDQKGPGFILLLDIDVYQIQSDRPATTLGMYLTKIRTGQSDERLATKFQISRRTLERKLKTARECLTEDFVPRYLGLNHITREEVVARNLRIPTHIFGGSQLNRQLFLWSTEHIFTFRRVRVSKEKPTAYTNSATTLVNLRRALQCALKRGEKGFVPESELVFECKGTGDYHESMNAVKFGNWFQAMLPRLEPNAVTSMDNASYHSRSQEKIPVTSETSSSESSNSDTEKSDSAKHVLTCSCFVKKMKKQALSVNNKSFNDRLAAAKTLSQDNSFLRSFSKMNKHAQNFIMIQIKSVDKKQKSVRFTNDEKWLALTLMKESPKGYRLIEKIFKLPSKRTLNRLAEMITFGVGINNNIFQLIERRALNRDIKKLCSIVFDEVALTHLTYVESKDEIRGFKD